MNNTTKPDADDKLPGWAVLLEDGRKVQLVRDAGLKRNLLVFTKAGHETTIVLSDAALAAVVVLATQRVGIPVEVG